MLLGLPAGPSIHTLAERAKRSNGECTGATQ